MSGEAEEIEILGPDLRLKDVLAAIPHMVKLVYRLVRDPRVPMGRKWLLAGVAAYLVLPIDIIPDFIPGLGQLDDAVLVLIVFEKLVVDCDDEILFDNWGGDPSVLARLLHILRSSPRDLRRLVGRRAGRTT
jgi:uncharacterized membrane protein YkvA (DUF1232 family)